MKRHALPILSVLLAAVCVVVATWGLSASTHLGLVPGGSSLCEGTATSLKTLARQHGTWEKTPDTARARFWDLRAQLLTECPLGGVTYFSTHTLGNFLRDVKNPIPS